MARKKERGSTAKSKQFSTAGRTLSVGNQIVIKEGQDENSHTPIEGSSESKEGE